MANEQLTLATTATSAPAVATTTLDRQSVASRGVASPELFSVPLRDIPTGYGIAKRMLDVVVSATVLLLLSPLLLATALIIKLTSPGPALFRQQRVGEGGRIFTMYKFRSMYTNADHSLHQKAYEHFIQGKGGNGKVTKETLKLSGVMQDTPEAIEQMPERQRGWLRQRLHLLRPVLRAEDPRITPVGALIRITSIDELPQFYNVLVGDMSLVGPRPPIPYEVQLYQAKHLQRLTVRPGVTCIWQIYGRNKVPFEQMIDMDLEYIGRRSFWLDLKLIIITAPAVLFSRAAK